MAIPATFDNGADLVLQFPTHSHVGPLDDERLDRAHLGGADMSQSLGTAASQLDVVDGDRTGLAAS